MESRRFRDNIPFKRSWKAFVKSPTGLLSTLALCLIIVLTILGPDGFGDLATEVDLSNASEGPTKEHSLGTDGLGRDLLARTLAATRTSVVLSLAAVGISVFFGSLIGVAFAMGGPRLRRIGAAIIDTLMSFGDILLAIVLIAIFGVGAKGAVLAIGVAFMPTFARFTFSLVSTINARDFIQAARTVGVARLRLIRVYILPNIADSLAIAAFTAVGEAIMAMSSLSFLGLGVQAPQFDWGQMLTDGVRNFYLNPYAAVAPAALIAITGLSLSLFGDALARAVNPILWDEAPREKRRFPIGLPKSRLARRLGR